MDFDIDLDLYKLDGEVFEELCEFILRLLDPKKIERLRGGGDRGRDIEALIPVLDTSVTRGDGLEEWWWVECKKRKDTGIGIPDISPNIAYALGENPPPPDIIFYMTTTHLTAAAVQTIRGIKTPFRIRYLDGNDIRRILLANPDILHKFFPDMIDKIPYPKGEQERSLLTKQVFVNAYRDFDYPTPVLSLRKGRTVNIDITVKNLSPQSWQDVSLSMQLPRGLRQIGKDNDTINLGPFETQFVTFQMEVELDTPNVDEMPILTTGFPDEECNIEYSYSKVDYQHSIFMPFVGRNVEIQNIINTLKQEPGVIVVEGLPGEGKTRLIEESKRILEMEGFQFGEIGSGSLNQATALVRIFASYLLGASDYKGVNAQDIDKAILRYEIQQSSKITGECFLDFLYGSYRPRKEELEQFMNLLDELVSPNKTEKPVIIMDDLHRVPPVVMETLELLLKIFGRTVSFIIGYRENEIDAAVRERLITLATEVIKLGPLPDNEIRSALANATRFPEDLVNELVSISQGNPYCLMESLRLLVEVGMARFNLEGNLEENDPGSCIEYSWPEDHLQNLEEYTHLVALRRYISFKENLVEDAGQIEEIVMFLAAASQPLPISLLESVYGKEALPLLDKLIDEQLLIVRRGEFAQELGIFLVHDCMAEALVRYGTKRLLTWASINRRLGQALVDFLDPKLLPDYSKKIAGYFNVAGDMERELEFLLMHFWKSVEMQYNSEISEVGEHCIEIIESLQSMRESSDKWDDNTTADIFLHIGIAEHARRRYKEMEENFRLCEIVSPVNRTKNHILNVYLSTAKMRIEPKNSDKYFSELQESLSYLQKIDDPSDEVVNALLHALNRSFTYYKKFGAHYDTALFINDIAIDLSKKYNRIGNLLWEEINHGTLILFQDEKLRNELDFESMPSVWEQALSYWTDVLFRAEEAKITEYIVETNCAVGFMKMFLGFGRDNREFCKEGFQHFRRARHYAEKFDHPYWLCKLNNHFGIHVALQGDFEEAENELRQGLVLANKIKNWYTIWMLHQNLANVAFRQVRLEEVRHHWVEGFRHAIEHYFKDASIAILNYNFRFFIRGFLLHKFQFPELDDIFDKYEALTLEIKNDAGLHNFQKFCSVEGNIKKLETYDAVFYGSYYNTH